MRSNLPRYLPGRPILKFELPTPSPIGSAGGRLPAVAPIATARWIFSGKLRITSNSPKPHRPCGGGHRAFAPALSIIHEAQYQENSWGKGPFTTAPVAVVIGPLHQHKQLPTKTISRDFPGQRPVSHRRGGGGVSSQYASMRRLTDQMRDKAAQIVRDRVFVLANTQATSGVTDNPTTENGEAVP
jgi:hypothetical protein